MEKTEKIVFTNGCFDLLHPGHLDLLTRAAGFGTRLIVGINSDASVRKIKGAPRPFMNERDRAEMLRGLRVVDEVRIFGESTPEKMIREIRPDVLVKGGDWQISEIVGADFVVAGGGEVYSLPLRGAFSSSGIVEKIQNARENPAPEKVSAAQPEGAGSFAGQFLAARREVFDALLASEIPNLEACAAVVAETLAAGGKIIFCAAGESAPAAQYLAAKFSAAKNVRAGNGRQIWRAVALTDEGADAKSSEKTDFAQYIENSADAGDLLIALASGSHSPEVNAAVMRARAAGCRTLALTGKSGKKTAALSDAAILVPSDNDHLIIETQLAAGHLFRCAAAVNASRDGNADSADNE